MKWPLLSIACAAVIAALSVILAPNDRLGFPEEPYLFYSGASMMLIVGVGVWIGMRGRRRGTAGVAHFTRALESAIFSIGLGIGVSVMLMIYASLLHDNLFGAGTP